MSDLASWQVLTIGVACRQILAEFSAGDSVSGVVGSGQCSCGVHSFLREGMDEMLRGMTDFPFSARLVQLMMCPADSPFGSLVVARVFRESCFSFPRLECVSDGRCGGSRSIGACLRSIASTNDHHGRIKGRLGGHMNVSRQNLFSGPCCPGNTV